MSGSQGQAVKNVVLMHGGFVDGSGWEPVYSILPPQDGFLFLDKAKFAASFAADLDPDVAAFRADSQVPWGLNALNGAVHEAAWRTKPSWYLVSTEDKMICPWNPGGTYPMDTVPTLFFDGTADTLVPPSAATAEYMSIPTTTHKVYAEFNGGTHFVANTPTGGNATDKVVTRIGLSWLEVYVVGDMRYQQFMRRTRRCRTTTRSRSAAYAPRVHCITGRR